MKISEPSTAALQSFIQKPTVYSNTVLFQVVWKSSVRLGMGYARTADRTGVYIVARYKAHGNVPRQYNAQVTKPAYLMRTFQNNCRREYNNS